MKHIFLSLNYKQANMDSEWGHYLDISDMRVEVTNHVDNRQIKSFMNKYVHKIKDQPKPQPHRSPQ